MSLKPKTQNIFAILQQCLLETREKKKKVEREGAKERKRDIQLIKCKILYI